MRIIKKFLEKNESLLSSDYILLFIKRVYQKAKENDIFIHAMGMVYITTLSFVPFLIFSFYIMTLFDFFGRNQIILEKFKSLILNNLAAGTGESLIEYLELYVLNINIEQLGIISFLSLIFIIVFMLARVEMTFNKIWNLREHRDFFKRFVSFWTFITLGTFSLTVLLTLSFLFADKYFNLWLDGDQFSQSSFFDYILFSFNFLFFILIYYYVPNTEVEGVSSLFAGVFSGFLFILSKKIYSVYTANLITYNQIYGPISAIPLFLLWLYLLWLIILLGAIISYVFQHRYNIQYLIKQKNFNKNIKNLVSTAILLAIYKNYKKENTSPLSLKKLNKKINLPAELIIKEIDSLKNRKLIIESKDGEYTPLNPVEKISVWDCYPDKSKLKDLNIDSIFKDQETQLLFKTIRNKEKNYLKQIKLKDYLL